MPPVVAYADLIEARAKEHCLSIFALSGGLDRMGGSASSRLWVAVLRVHTSPQSHMRNRSMSDSIRFVGLDVHADSITVAVAGEGRGEARHIARYLDDFNRLLNLMNQPG